MPHPPRPRVVDDALLLPDAAGGAASTIALGSAAWYAWLAAPQHTSFTVVTATGAITVRQEQQGQHGYWYAYRKHAGQLRKAYLGPASAVTPQHLQAAVQRLYEQAAPVAPLRLRLLGPPELDGPTPVLPLPAKALALLAYLAALCTPVPRERLLGLLWPDSGRTAAHKNLRNTLWTIRRSLGAHVVDVGDLCLALHGEVWTDVRAFLQGTERVGRAQPVAPPASTTAPDVGALAESLDLYRGPLLDAVVLQDAPEFELWLTTERAHLHQRYL